MYHSAYSTAQTLDPDAQDGSVCIQDIFDEFLDSDGNWRFVIYLYIQCMEGHLLSVAAGWCVRDFNSIALKEKVIQCNALVVIITFFMAHIQDNSSYWDDFNVCFLISVVIKVPDMKSWSLFVTLDVFKISSIHLVIPKKQMCLSLEIKKYSKCSAIYQGFVFQRRIITLRWALDDSPAVFGISSAVPHRVHLQCLSSKFPELCWSPHFPFPSFLRRSPLDLLDSTMLRHMHAIYTHATQYVIPFLDLTMRKLITALTALWEDD